MGALTLSDVMGTGRFAADAANLKPGGTVAGVVNSKPPPVMPANSYAIALGSPVGFDFRIPLILK
jgi:hypothetical protein